MAQKTAFVTGATGFLGLNLVEQLTEAGWAVMALHRATSDLNPLSRFDVERVEGDLTDPASLQRALPAGLDAVFHLAADTSMWARHNARQTAINVTGTANILAAARAAKTRRFVHTSTWNTYGLEQGRISETLPQRGGESWINYNSTKFEAEERVRAAVAEGLEAVILNPCHILGRYDRSGWARIIIDLCRHWIPAAPPGAGSFCHGEAVVKAHIAAAERGRVGQNYLLGGADASLLEMMQTIGSVAGCRAPRVALPAAIFRLLGRANVARAALTGHEPELTPEGAEMVCLDARIVSTRAQEELGYEPAALRHTIEDSHAWLKAEGLLGR